jgi:hypothetical protein
MVCAGSAATDDCAGAGRECAAKEEQRADEGESGI